MTFYITLFSFFYSVIYAFALQDFNFNFTMKGLGLAFILSSFCQVVPFLLLYAALKNLGPVKVSIISNIEIPVVAILSYFLLNSDIHLIQVIGIFLVMFSVIRINTNSFL